MTVTTLAGASERWAARPLAEAAALVAAGGVVLVVDSVARGHGVLRVDAVPTSVPEVVVVVLALVLATCGIFLVLRVGVWAVWLAPLEIVDTGDHLRLQWAGRRVREVAWADCLIVSVQSAGRFPELHWADPPLFALDVKDVGGHASFTAQLLVDPRREVRDVSRLAQACRSRGLWFRQVGGGDLGVVAAPAS